MVLLPLFWDQYDNAQRVHECGLGTRLSTYGHQPEELIASVHALLDRSDVRRRLTRISGRLGADPGVVRGADAVEQLATATHSGSAAP